MREDIKARKLDEGPVLLLTMRDDVVGLNGEMLTETMERRMELPLSPQSPRHILGPVLVEQHLDPILSSGPLDPGEDMLMDG